MSEQKQQNLGGGIIAVSVIQIIFSVISAIVWILALLFKDAISNALAKSGQANTLTTTNSIVLLLLAIFSIIGAALILQKKAAGVYIYFAQSVIYVIFNLITSKFSIASLIFSLIIPVLLGIFILLKKQVFGFGTNVSTEINA